MINRSNHISSCTFIVFTLISKNTHAYINHIEAILQDQTICISYKKVSIGIFFFSMASGSIEGTRNDYRNHCHRCRNTFPTKKSFENHMKTHKGDYKCFTCVRVYLTKVERDEHVKNGGCSKK
jgi:hypothetical protein